MLLLYFVSVDEVDKENLKDLKRGEKVTIIGKKQTEEDDKGHKNSYSEIDAVVRADGTRIPLGQ